MIQTLREGTNHKYFKALTPGLHQFHIGWLQGTQNACFILEQMQKQVTEEEDPNVSCFPGVQTVWNLPGGSRGSVCPSVEVKQLVGNDPEATQQLTLPSNEELTSCSPWSCPCTAGLL